MPLLGDVELFVPQGPISELLIVTLEELRTWTQSPLVEVILRPEMTRPVWPMMTMGPEGVSEAAWALIAKRVTPTICARSMLVANMANVLCRVVRKELYLLS